MAVIFRTLVVALGRKFVRPLLWRMGLHVSKISPQDRDELETSLRQLSGSSFSSVFGSSAGRLVELRARYSGVTLPIAIHSAWDPKRTSEATVDIGFGGGIDLRIFRGHSAIVWSLVGSDPRVGRLIYFIYADAVRKKDAARLFEKLDEDGAFGCIRFELPGIGFVSRDLMDSVAEINFLHKHLNVLGRDDLRVLDIGAGYGRMAHRMLESNPRIKSYTCVDAVPESTFLSEFYLKYRGLQDRANVIPLDEVERKLLPGQYDLALNIHSFSECTYAAIEWWLTRVKEIGVRHLFIIPNRNSFHTSELDGPPRDYAPLLRSLGFELVAEDALFDDPSVQEMLGVRDRMYLFEQKER